MQKSDLIKALDLVYKQQMTTGTVDWKGEFTATPQYIDTQSDWALLVIQKKLQPWEIAWAFTNGARRKWLAARIQTDGRAFYFNLQNSDDREKLEEMKIALDFGGLPYWAAN